MVEIFSSPTCADCMAAKMFLSEHNIHFTEYDVNRESEADALKHLTGKSIVPTLVIGGKILYGFAANRKEIEGLLLGND